MAAGNLPDDPLRVSRGVASRRLGATAPPLPNKSIHGKLGVLSEEEEKEAKKES